MNTRGDIMHTCEDANDKCSNTAAVIPYTGWMDTRGPNNHNSLSSFHDGHTVRYN